MKLFDELEKYCNNNGIGLQIDVFRKDKNRYELTLDNFSPEELKNIRDIISDYAKIEDDVYLAGNGRAIDIYFETLDESKTSARKSIKESKGADKLDVLSLCYYCAEDVDVEIYSYYNANDEVKLLDSFKRKNYLGSAYKYNQIESFEIDGNTMIIYLEQDTEIM